VAAYAEAALDFRLYGVLEFHVRLQALRRRVWYAAVAANAATGSVREQTAAETAEANRQLAAPPEEPGEPLLVVATGGWVGTGKSTVSQAAARILGAPRLEVDRVSASLIHDPPVEPIRSGGHWEHEADWERHFAPGFTEAVYAELFRQARLVTESGRSVVLDGCFARQPLRDAARRMADEGGARFVFLECRLDRDLHRRRIAERERQLGTKPGTWTALTSRSEQLWEPATELDAKEHHVIDTSLDPSQTYARVEELLAGFQGGESVTERVSDVRCPTTAEEESGE
jgi:predicted kinase